MAARSSDNIPNVKFGPRGGYDSHQAVVTKDGTPVQGLYVRVDMPGVPESSLRIRSRRNSRYLDFEGTVEVPWLRTDPSDKMYDGYVELDRNVDSVNYDTRMEDGCLRFFFPDCEGKVHLNHAPDDSPNPNTDLKHLRGEIQELKRLVVGQHQQPVAGQEFPEHSLYDIEPMPVGDGSYGTVFKAVHKQTKDVYAVKMLILDERGIVSSMAREMAIQLDLKHENLVRLRHIFTSRGTLNLVMEFIDSNLQKILRDPNIDVKEMLCQILHGVDYLHKNHIIHRDLKPENILVAKNKLKICDFGLSRYQSTEMTPEVTTFLYRAPELLSGSFTYTPAVDLWSVGCIFAELLCWDTPFGRDYSKRTRGRGHHDAEGYIGDIFRALGTPTEEIWPGVKNLSRFPAKSQIHPIKPLEFQDGDNTIDPHAKDLLGKLLCLVPDDRITAEKALEHAYFSS